jgi:uncharacterized protein YbjT (DUF2867 family)
MVRSPESAKKVEALTAAEIVVGDFDDGSSLERALSGVERAFLLTSSSEKRRRSSSHS